MIFNLEYTPSREEATNSVVEIEKLCINKLHPDCDAFFLKGKLNVSEEESVWWDKVPLRKNKSTMI